MRRNLKGGSSEKGVILFGSKLSASSQWNQGRVFLERNYVTGLGHKVSEPD